MAPDLRGRVLDGLARRGLTMPSIYVGGAMHEERLADDTIARSMGAAAKALHALGCRAVVGNPTPSPPAPRRPTRNLPCRHGCWTGYGAAGRDGRRSWVHNHTPEMRSQAREWWHTLRNTDARRVRVALDIDWVHQGDQDPLALLRAAGPRVASLHLRPLDEETVAGDIGEGDVDYRPVASELKASGSIRCSSSNSPTIPRPSSAGHCSTTCGWAAGPPNACSRCASLRLAKTTAYCSLKRSPCTPHSNPVCRDAASSAARLRRRSRLRHTRGPLPARTHPRRSRARSSWA